MSLPFQTLDEFSVQKSKVKISSVSYLVPVQVSCNIYLSVYPTLACIDQLVKNNTSKVKGESEMLAIAKNCDDTIVTLYNLSLEVW